MVFDVLNLGKMRLSVGWRNPDAVIPRVRFDGEGVARESELCADVRSAPKETPAARKDNSGALCDEMTNATE